MSDQLAHEDLDASSQPGGPPALRIANAVGRLHKELAGRGPTKVRTYIQEDMVACVLEGGLTRAEQTVLEHAGTGPVVEMRLRLQAAMRPSIVEIVEGILGRSVRSFMSANDPGSNLQVETLLLEPQIAGSSAPFDGDGARD